MKRKFDIERDDRNGYLYGSFYLIPDSYDWENFLQVISSAEKHCQVLEVVKHTIVPKEFL